jgi:hypothetical protein
LVGSIGFRSKKSKNRLKLTISNIVGYAPDVSRGYPVMIVTAERRSPVKRLVLTMAMVVLAGLGCTHTGKTGGGYLLMASTIGPIDAGIVDVLENAFEKDSGIRVRHVGAGTGATLKIAEKGEIDLVMVHAKALEEKFVAEGFGTERIDLMYNDFVIMGPAADPAGVKGSATAVEALKKSPPNRRCSSAGGTSPEPTWPKWTCGPRPESSRPAPGTWSGKRGPRAMPRP